MSLLSWWSRFNVKGLLRCLLAPFLPASTARLRLTGWTEETWGKLCTYPTHCHRGTSAGNNAEIHYDQSLGLIVRGVWAFPPVDRVRLCWTTVICRWFLQRCRRKELHNLVPDGEAGLSEAAFPGPAGARLQRRHGHGLQLPGRPVVRGGPRPEGKSLTSIESPSPSSLQPGARCKNNKCCRQATSPYQSWRYEDQIAGFYQQFGNITFLTVKVGVSGFSDHRTFSDVLWNNSILCVSGRWSHGSSVGSRSSFPDVPDFHNKWAVLSHDGRVRYLHSSYDYSQGGSC